MPEFKIYNVNRPNFFIVGAPKCGTTAMNDYLARHPDIFMAKKEIHYFGSDLKTKYKVTYTEFLDYFKSSNDKVIGEASVWYLFSQMAAKEIKDFSPAAKILIMLRNPVDVLYSLHSQHLYDGNEDVTDFERAISLDAERKKGNKLPDSVDYTELPPYIDSVLFADQVKRYLDAFGEENVRIILYDDFVKNTDDAVAGTLKFLGLANINTGEYRVINLNKSIRLFFLHRLIKNPPPRLRKIVRIILPFKAVRHHIMSYFSRLNIKYKKRKKMDDQLRLRLKEKLAEDISSLSKIIKRNLSAWM